MSFYCVPIFLFYREDLPHRLVLPPAVRDAKTSQELSALAMLGQGESKFSNISVM